MDPRAAALQFKTQLEGTGAYQVTPDGQVRFTAERGGGFVPPWVWSEDLHNQVPMTWKLPGSDPSSVWHSMYQSGGPFSKASAWDSSAGTYEGGIDWPTLLGTIGVGSLFAAPAIGAILGGGGGPTVAGGTTAGSASGGPAAALAGANAGLLPGGATVGNLGALVPATSGSSALGASAGLLPGTATVGNIGGLVPATAPSGAVGAASAGGGALSASSPLMKALAGVGGLVGGHIAGGLAANAAVPPQLTDLLDAMSQRTKAQTPIFNAVQQGTWTGLPSYATQGLTPPKAI